MLTFEGAGEYKTFEPSLSETFIFVLEGELELSLGETIYVAKAGQSIYYQATKQHQLRNHLKKRTKVLIVARNHICNIGGKNVGNQSFHLIK